MALIKHEIQLKILEAFEAGYQVDDIQAQLREVGYDMPRRQILKVQEQALADKAAQLARIGTNLWVRELGHLEKCRMKLSEHMANTKSLDYAGMRLQLDVSKEIRKLLGVDKDKAGTTVNNQLSVANQYGQAMHALDSKLQRWTPEKSEEELQKELEGLLNDEQ